MSPIQDFKVKYEAVNKENTFSAGDTIKGMVTFTLTKETKIKCLYVKAKGDAHVHWTDSQGHGDHQNNETHHAHKRYYKAKELLVAENKDGTVLSSGDHRYQFMLKIPEGNIPPSFKGCSGNIVHVLQAKMSRSWHTSSSDKKELNFVSRTFLPLDQSPQTGSVNKSVGTFSKGGVLLSATVNKRICSPGSIAVILLRLPGADGKLRFHNNHGPPPVIFLCYSLYVPSLIAHLNSNCYIFITGDTLHVTAKITNKSSKKMKIKFKILQK
uniref:Arrestin-like N-terminal domain-containing protein n=1 Tax=Neogobius melanostomus TaxID=47308 RepID=A0A8C6WXQ9_9GOBI